MSVPRTAQTMEDGTPREPLRLLGFQEYPQLLLLQVVRLSIMTQQPPFPGMPLQMPPATKYNSIQKLPLRFPEHPIPGRTVHWPVIPGRSLPPMMQGTVDGAALKLLQYHLEYLL